MLTVRFGRYIKVLKRCNVRNSSNLTKLLLHPRSCIRYNYIDPLLKAKNIPSKSSEKLKKHYIETLYSTI